ncbi:MAG: BspA family leucine-rich repeat surface protein, partial [Lachnospira sp.]|nr:BspA family leucine-rich repeat surface protein [Lachnospira sp.]
MRREIKKFRKLMAIAVAVMVLAGAMPLSGLEGVFKFNLVRVEAAEADPFDTSKLTVTGSGKYEGAAWTYYDNGLLWVEDDTSGETSYSGDTYTLSAFLESESVTMSSNDIKYVYWNITAPKNCSEMFAHQSMLEIRFGNVFSTTNVTSMWRMFYGCSSLIALNVSTFDTTSVTSMSQMFDGCKALTSLDVSNFNTTNVTGMWRMFYDCESLTSLDIRSFNTYKVTNANFIFSECANLHIISLPSHFTEAAKDVALDGEWYELSDDSYISDSIRYNTIPVNNEFSITLVNVGNHSYDTITDNADICAICGICGVAVPHDPFDTSKHTVVGSGKCAGAAWTMYDNGLLWVVDDKSGQTSYASDGIQLSDIAGTSEFKALGTDIVYVCWDSTAQADSSQLFTNSPVSGSKTGTVEIIRFGDTFIKTSGNMTTTVHMFSYSFVEIIEGLEDLDTSNVTDMSYMFYNCKSITSLDVSGFDTSNVIDMSCMFYSCKGLTGLDVSGFDTSNVTDMDSVFSDCVSVTSLDVSGFDTSNVTDMSYMFDNCEGLTGLDVSGFDTSNVTDMSYMFDSCKGLTGLDVSGLDTSNVTDMGSMFGGCSGLTSLDVSMFDTSNVTDMGSMFGGCSGLTSLNVSGFNTSKVTTMDGMFWSCSNLTSLDLSGFDTSKVTDMRGMFGGNTISYPEGIYSNGCISLTTLDLSNFDTSKVKDMNRMFSGCSGLTSLDISGFDTSNVTDMGYMFSGCSSLTELDMGSVRAFNVKSMDSMYSGCSSLRVLKLGSIVLTDITSTKYTFYDCISLHTIEHPYVKSGDGIELPYNFYKLNSEGAVDKSVAYTKLSKDIFAGELLVREVTHKCDTVTDGIGTCNMCGVDIMYGDCDDNKKINIIDAVMLKKHLAGDTTTNINEGAANVNADIKISVEDAVKLMKKLAGMDVKLGVAE